MGFRAFALLLSLYVQVSVSVPVRTFAGYIPHPPQFLPSACVSYHFGPALAFVPFSDRHLQSMQTITFEDLSQLGLMVSGPFEPRLCS